MNEKIRLIITFLIVLLVLLILFIIVYVKAPAATTKTLNNWGTVLKNKTFDFKKINENKINKVYESYNKSKNSKTIEDPYIYINPYGNGLSASIIFEKNKNIENISYTVQGKTEQTNININNVDFKTTNNTVEVPIIGLYSDYENTIEVQYVFSDNTTEKHQYQISVEPLENVVTHLDIDVVDQNEYNEMLNGKLFFTSNLKAYDINGDLRINLVVDDYSTDKSINFEEIPNGIYIEPFMMFHNNKLIEVNLMGLYNLESEMILPEDYEYHHDITTDNEGNYYVLGSIKFGFFDKMFNVLNITEGYSEVSEDSVIIYNSDKEYVKTIDLGYLIEEEEVRVLKNSVQNDLHLNSIEYWDDLGLISVSSKTTSEVYFINPELEEIEYIFGEPGNEYYQDKYFTVENPDNFVYPSGLHTAYQIESLDVNNTSKEYLSVFNNNTCINDTGNNYKENVDDINDCAVNNASINVYEINFPNRTIKMIKNIKLNSTSKAQGSVFTTENFIIAASESEDTYVYDNEGNLLATLKTSELKERYRINIIDKNEMSSMI